MPTTQDDIEFLEHLASCIECIVYEVEQIKGPPVVRGFLLLEAEWPDPFRQSFAVDYQQWYQLTEAMVRTGKDLSQRLRQVLRHSQHIEWNPGSVSTPV
jgi:hypothetical protein